MVEIEGNGVHAVRDKDGKWYVPGAPNAKAPNKDMYLAEGKKPEKMFKLMNSTT